MHQSDVSYGSEVIITVVLHHSSGKSLLFIHHYFRLNLIFTFGPPSLKKSSIWPPAKNFGDLCRSHVGGIWLPLSRLWVHSFSVWVQKEDVGTL